MLFCFTDWEGLPEGAGLSARACGQGVEGQVFQAQVTTRQRQRRLGRRVSGKMPMVFFGWIDLSHEIFVVDAKFHYVFVVEKNKDEN